MKAVCYIGIDVAKDRLDVHLRPLAKTIAVTNDSNGITRLLEVISSLHVERIVLEASGGYEKAAFLAMAEAGHAVFRPRETRPLTEVESQLAEYVAYRRYLIREMICARNQLRCIEAPSLRATLERRLAAAKAECKSIEAELVNLARSSEKRDLFDLLTSVPGVGALLACTLIASLRELGTLSRREIASLVGVAPMNNDSGRRRGHRFVTGGRGSIRTVLYMATLTASRFNAAISAFYGRLRLAGKPSKVALTACMRKLLTVLNAMVRDRRPWAQPASLCE